MKKWEYDFIIFNNLPSALRKELNERGVEGWELISANKRNNSKYELIFKKELL